MLHAFIHICIKSSSATNLTIQLSSNWFINVFLDFVRTYICNYVNIIHVFRFQCFFFLNFLYHQGIFTLVRLKALTTNLRKFMITTPYSDIFGNLPFVKMCFGATVPSKHITCHGNIRGDGWLATPVSWSYQYTLSQTFFMFNKYANKGALALPSILSYSAICTSRQRRFDWKTVLPKTSWGHALPKLFGATRSQNFWGPPGTPSQNFWGARAPKTFGGHKLPKLLGRRARRVRPLTP